MSIERPTAASSLDPVGNVAAAHDQEAGARLYLHQQYQQGMEAVRDRLRGTVVHVGRNWLGIQHPAFEAPPVVPLRPPSGAAEARDRVALRAGAA